MTYPVNPDYEPKASGTVDYLVTVWTAAYAATLGGPSYPGAMEAGHLNMGASIAASIAVTDFKKALDKGMFEPWR